MRIQSTARMKDHDRVDGGRIHGGVFADETRGATDGGVADGRGDHGADGERQREMWPNTTNG